MAPALDEETVQKAQGTRDDAKRARVAAEARLKDAESKLAAAEIDAASAASAMKSFLKKVQDPSGKLAKAKARGEVLKEEKERLEKELAAVNDSPRPGRKRLIDKSPVARAAEGDEFHFEVRGDRVAFIDLDRLLQRVIADARMQQKLVAAGRPIQSTVGPIGDFSLRYELGTQIPDPSELLSGRVTISYGLRGWRIVPVIERRGETYESTRHPASSFARAVHRLSPGRDTITMWVYPDGFALYRRLRDELNSQGFLVAGRPLPDGVPIQGSPGGSRSAGQ
jgi:hypothetical protein